MERAKKMVLLSKEQLERLQRDSMKPDEIAGLKAPTSTAPGTVSVSTQPVADSPTSAAATLQSSQTIGDNLSRLDNEMKKILDSTAYENDHQKLKDYLSVLRSYLFFIEEKRKPLNLKIDEEKPHDNVFSNYMSDEIILNSVPKHYKKKAQLLLNHLKNNSSRIAWNEKGTVYIDGKKIKNSNIIDLINDATRNRKSIKSLGRQEFANLLCEINTPREYVGNSQLWLVRDDSSLARKRLRQQSETEELDEWSDDTPLLENKSGNKSNSVSSLFNTVLPNNKSNISGDEYPASKRSLRSSTPIATKFWIKL